METVIQLIRNVTLGDFTSENETTHTAIHGQSPRWAHAHPEHPIQGFTQRHSTHTLTTPNSLASVSVCTLCRRLAHRGRPCQTINAERQLARGGAHGAISSRRMAAESTTTRRPSLVEKVEECFDDMDIESGGEITIEQWREAYLSERPPEIE